MALTVEYAHAKVASVNHEEDDRQVSDSAFEPPLKYSEDRAQYNQKDQAKIYSSVDCVTWLEEAQEICEEVDKRKYQANPK